MNGNDRIEVEITEEELAELLKDIPAVARYKVLEKSLQESVKQTEESRWH